MSIDDYNLITDRTAADAKRVKELEKKIAEQTATNEEITEWLKDSKGAYNASDMNRVANATKYIAERLKDIGIQANVTAKNDWKETDYIDAVETDAYIKDAEKIRNALNSGARLPVLPETLEDLTLEGANAIEKNLLVQNESINEMNKINIPSGAYCAAAVGCTK